jgi:hypothetical protein
MKMEYSVFKVEEKKDGVLPSLQQHFNPRSVRSLISIGNRMGSSKIKV